MWQNILKIVQICAQLCLTGGVGITLTVVFALQSNIWDLAQIRINSKMLKSFLAQYPEVEDAQYISNRFKFEEEEINYIIILSLEELLAHIGIDPYPTCDVFQ